MEDDDDDNKVGLIDVNIPTVAINHSHNGDHATAAVPNADELIEAALADNHLAINRNSQCDCVYLHTMRKFQSFVDTQRDLGVLDAGPTYVMGQNMDLFSLWLWLTQRTSSLSQRNDMRKL
jgi:predicted helicase